MIFKETAKIYNYDVDMHGILRPTALLAKLEEAGSHQMLVCPPSNDDLRAKGMGFILSRVVMRIYTAPRDGDAVEVQTFATDSRGLSFNRCYRMLRQGEVLADVYTVWALLNFKEHRLVRVKEGNFMAKAGLQAFVETAALNLVYVADMTVYEGRKMPAEKVKYLCGQDAAGYAENVNLYTAGLEGEQYFFALAQSVGK